MPPEPRGAQRRKDDTLTRLHHDTDVWVATADPDGDAHLVPLSFLWWEGSVVVATPGTTPTARNLAAGRAVRVAAGETRDVVMITGAGGTLGDDPGACADAFADKHGWDPRAEGGFTYYRVFPSRIQAWREADEMRGRTLMRDGTWVV
ncbi:pyridoxamine 5'-phosphate oxidase [Haloactinospora alba]|uniref:Pyridoxamine 5'-phosphate oxidase n=1 Tax=Haloactinospora alba TaxID=405555 RepID=A0A543NAD3_9ACTN|nr:pyridoxamine 5'-phosphate oxidase family protein [Haloactinospora alba]TQN28758.1 pyridoxamine 5'-phosphate oxidase [Haloactinospora alba]